MLAASYSPEASGILMLHCQPTLYCREEDIHRNSLVFESGSVYSPRRPEESILHGVVAENLETFLARQQERERTVPQFVERELRSFLDCGILANG